MSALDRVNARPVCEVARMPGPAADELFSIAAGSRRTWTLPDWLALLAELDTCHESVEFWRALHE